MATLYLELAGALYRVMPGAAMATWTLLALPGGKRPGACYLVSAHGCSCPDFQYRKAACKHRWALVELGLLPAPTVEGRCADGVR